MADLRSNFIGIKSPNPFWLASAPPIRKKGLTWMWCKPSWLAVQPVLPILING